jgi:hypothetical protein
MLDKILNSFGMILKFGGVMIGLLIVGSIIEIFYVIGTQDTKAETNKGVVAQANKDKSNNAITPENWTYDKDEDKMRGSKTYLAINMSTTELNLGVPYEHSQMTIELRNKQGVTDVMLGVVGQFHCGTGGSCSINAKFDEHPIEKFNVDEADDGRTDLVFIEKSADFIEKIKKSKHVIIETELFNAGTQQYEFDVAGLKWE